MLGAGTSATPQIVAPGCIDLIDYPSWQEIPDRFKGREFHDHNRLIRSTGLTPDERRQVVQAICARLGESRGPVEVLLPIKGLHGWDQRGLPFHDPAGLQATISEFHKRAARPVAISEVDAHINDSEFSEQALAILDRWRNDGTVSSGPAGASGD